MKKFTSGANGHMLSLFQTQRKKKKDRNFKKGKTAPFFLHMAALAPRAFLITWPSDCKLQSREESARKKRRANKFHLIMSHDDLLSNSQQLDTRH